MVRGGEKPVFSLCWALDRRASGRSALQPSADGCMGLHCFGLVWVKLSSVEKKATTSLQTAVPHLTLITSMVMNTPSVLQPGCHLGQPAHLCPSPACGQLIVELTTCPCFSHIDQFLPHPPSAFPLSSFLSPLIVHPSPSPPFINILLLLGGPERHECYSTGTTRAAGCISLYY